MIHHVQPYLGLIHICVEASSFKIVSQQKQEIMKCSYLTRQGPSVSSSVHLRSDFSIGQSPRSSWSELRHSDASPFRRYSRLSAPRLVDQRLYVHSGYASNSTYISNAVRRKRLCSLSRIFFLHSRIFVAVFSYAFSPSMWMSTEFFLWA